MSQFHVSQIETHVRTQYEAEHWRDDLDDVNNLSRLLALHAVGAVLGPGDDAQRIIEITDGTDDRGIDAIGVDPTAKLVVLVQSKWRQDGTGSMALADVLKFLHGVRSLLGMKAPEEPVHTSQETRDAVHEVLRTPGARIRLVTATTASEPLADAVETPILELLSQLNDLEGIEPLATHTHLDQARFFNSLTEVAAVAVDIEVQLQDWGRAAEPVKLFYGRVSAAEVAGWYQAHGPDLFADNIRVVIPRSDINEGILQTIRDSPEYFGFYNNGITILARDIEIGPGGMLNKDVGYLKLTGASVVNGAQTVSTLGKVLGSEAEANLGNAFVLVRCIEVPAADEDLGRRITRFANTQNEVSSQDFAFLDDEQHRLRRELSVLGYEYILRSAEVPKTTDSAKVIDVREAAVGLACCSPGLGPAVVAKREVSRLFSDSSIYPALFNPGTDALRLARSVEVTRKVDAVLDSIEKGAAGIEAGVAVHGRRLIAHAYLRELGDEFLADPDSDMDDANGKLEDRVKAMLADLVAVFPDNSYPGNVFKNQARCTNLLNQAGLA